MEDGSGYNYSQFCEMVNEICRRHVMNDRRNTWMALQSIYAIVNPNQKKERALDLIDTLSEGLAILRRQIEEMDGSRKES